MGLNAPGQAVIDGPQIQGVFEGAEGGFHFHELLIAQGDVRGAQGIIGGTEQVLAVQAFLRLYFRPVKLGPALLVDRP